MPKSQIPVLSDDDPLLKKPWVEYLEDVREDNIRIQYLSQRKSICLPSTSVSWGSGAAFENLKNARNLRRDVFRVDCGGNENNDTFEERLALQLKEISKRIREVGCINLRSFLVQRAKASGLTCNSIDDLR